MTSKVRRNRLPYENDYPQQAVTDIKDKRTEIHHALMVLWWTDSTVKNAESNIIGTYDDDDVCISII